MTDIPSLLDNLAKQLRQQLGLDTSSPQGITEQDKELQLESDQDQEQEQEQPHRIPQVGVAVFWDYENFPIPKDVNETLFFEALLASRHEERYLFKRVYAKPEIITPKLHIIQKNGFEYKQGVLSGKPNEIDHVMMLDCLDVCNKSEEPLMVILMAGDVDYIALVEKLTENGHEVRIICNNKEKIAPALQHIIPAIFDRTNIEASIKQLERQLYNFSSLTNYLLSLEENQSVSIDELIQEIQKYYLYTMTRQISSQIRLLQDLPDYNWQYQISNDMIQKLPLSASSGPQDPVASRATARKNGLFFELGYVDDFDAWRKTWSEFQTFEPDLKRQKNILLELYKIVSVPHIRNFIQRELIGLLLMEQQAIPTQKHTMFQNLNNYTTLVQNLSQKHVAKKIIVCTVCKNKFRTKKSLQQHTRAVHQKKRPANLCPICGKHLNHQNSVANHQKQVHQPDSQPLPHECHICYLRFTTSNGLDSHKKSKH